MVTTSPALAPVDDLDRRLKWRVIPILLFLLMLVGLGSVATFSLMVRRMTMTGLPDDRDVAIARELLHGRVSLGAGGLRFVSALTGVPEATGAASGQAERLDDAAAAIARARRRHPLDARLAACEAHLALLRGDLSRAESAYEWALFLPGYCAEAHLGYGVALALDGRGRANPVEQRQRLLRALGQLAAVRASAPEHFEALYDRVVLLREVERPLEADALTRRYLEADPTSAWARQLREAR